MSTVASGPHEAPSSDHSTALAERRTSLASARSHLANERTHLAYVRTAIALLGFGITLNRFSIYLVQDKKVGEHQSVEGLYDVEKIGIGMAVSGLGLLAWSLYRFWATHRDLERGTFSSHYRPAVAFTLVLFALGGLSTLWLLRR